MAYSTEESVSILYEYSQLSLMIYIFLLYLIFQFDKFVCCSFFFQTPFSSLPLPPSNPLKMYYL